MLSIKLCINQANAFHHAQHMLFDQNPRWCAALSNAVQGNFPALPTSTHSECGKSNQNTKIILEEIE